MTHRALSVLVAIVAVGFGASALNLGRIQIVQAEKYKEKAEANQLQDTLLTAQRGNIYDANEKVLAQSANVWKVFIDPSRIPNEEVRETVCQRLSDILDVSYDTVMTKAKLSHMQYLDVKRRVELPQKVEISNLMKERVSYTVQDGNKLIEKKVAYSSMIGIDPDVKRYYPHHNFASAVIGFSGTDDIGREGLEYRYNTELTGVSGRRITAKNGRSDLMPLQYETLYDPKQGHSLVLTLDEVIQRYLEKGLEQLYIDTQGKATYGIVMDVRTGAILAMAGMPNYDLNDPQKIVDQKALKAISVLPEGEERQEAVNNAKFAQWRNRIISDTYEPGSVFKIVTAAAALEEKTFSLNRTYTCTGSIRVKDRTIHCHNHGGHGTQDFTHGMMNSCNPFFITVGQSLGIDKFYKYFEAFGFTEKTGIDLPAEAQPVGGVTYHKKEAMTIVNLASCSFGQTFQVSPIQIITMVSAIANGGKLMRPYVVAKELDENGNAIQVTEPVVRRQVISEETAKTVAEMMRMVVAEGTGKNAYIAGFNVAGKTGTSQKIGAGSADKYISSFTCFAPARDARIAILITVDEPVGARGGGQVVAPVAARVMEDSLNYLNVEPNYTQEELSLLYRRAPGVISKSIADAAENLQKGGLTEKVVGNGKTVLSQVPAEGQTLSKGGVVILYTDQNGVRTTKVPDFMGLTISQATARAAAAGMNIKISGNALRSGEIYATKQSAEAGETIELGRFVTVYFKSNTGVTDFAD